MKTITVEALKILMAIDALGPEVSTRDVTDWMQKNGIKLSLEGGTRRASLQGALRQCLRGHEAHGRIKSRQVEGIGHAGKIYLWSITGDGRDIISREIKDFRNMLDRRNILAG